jgi:DNA-binding GntR family transcriptional regulator
MSDSPKRPPTAQEFVLEQLRREIVTRQLLPGAPIRQELLADKYGTSRVPLREALKILEGEGQVTYVPHRGYFVADLSLDDLNEVYEIREILESKALTAAVARMTSEDVEAARLIHQRLDAATASGDVVAMTALNRDFHFALFDISAMPRLVRLIRLLWDSTDAYRSMYYAEFDNRQAVRGEHAAMLDALVKGDAEALVNLHHQHRTHAINALSRVLAD